MPLQLSTLSWGNGPRRALLIHGASSSAAVWWRLGPDLATLGFTVVAPDLRGHGTSPRDGDWSLAAYCKDLVALGGGWDVVLGHSLGGLLAVLVQHAQPGFAQSLILEDPALRFQATPEFVSWLEEEFVEPITIARMAAAQPAWHPRDIETKVRALNAVGLEAILATFRAAGEVDEWDTFRSLDVPRLLLAADPANRALVTPDDTVAMAAEDGVETSTIPGSSHSIHRDSYAQFWGAVRSFVTGNIR